MLNKNYEYKINLRNKFYKKTINKYIKINKSLQLLNEYNKKIYNQLGGTKIIEELDQIITKAEQNTERMKLEQEESKGTNINYLQGIVDKITQTGTNLMTKIQEEQTKIQTQLQTLGENIPVLNKLATIDNYVKESSKMKVVMDTINKNVQIRVPNKSEITTPTQEASSATRTTEAPTPVAQTPPPVAPSATEVPTPPPVARIRSATPTRSAAASAAASALVKVLGANGTGKAKLGT